MKSVVETGNAGRSFCQSVEETGSGRASWIGTNNSGSQRVSRISACQLRDMCDKGLTQQAWVVQICTLERNDGLLTSFWEITWNIRLVEIVCIPGPWASDR